MSKRPAWTVCYNTVSIESEQWIGTGWEFFNKYDDAEKCFKRQCAIGNCPTLRLYHEQTDCIHLGAVHKV